MDSTKLTAPMQREDKKGPERGPGRSGWQPIEERLSACSSACSAPAHARGVPREDS